MGVEMKSLGRVVIAAALGVGMLNVPAAQAADCVDTSPAEAQAAIEDAKRAVLTMEYEATLGKLDEVRRSLTCLTGTLPTETLALLYFYQGLMRAYTEDEVGALESFQDAAAIMPLLQEDREHGTQIRDLWSAAREEATRNTGTIAIPDLPKESVAYINGRPLDSESDSEGVYPGVHLLQIWGDDRELHGTLIRVRPNETTIIPSDFMASLTPRGELVLDISPRRADVLIRQGNNVIYDLENIKRRELLSDVKEGAYIVEVDRPGYYPYSQGKVAVEGGDQTILDVTLERRPSVSLISRGGVFFVSSQDGYNDPLVSFDLVGRLSSGWGLHVEYFHHLQLPDDPTPATLAWTPNPEFEDPNQAGYPTEADCNPGNGQTIDATLNDDDAGVDLYYIQPECIPNVSTRDLPFNTRLYLGFSRQFHVEMVDFAFGGKFALDIYRFSVLGEFSVSYSPVPYVGFDARVAFGPMMHMSPFIWDKYEDVSNGKYFDVGLVGTVGGGIRIGF